MPGTSRVQILFYCSSWAQLPIITSSLWDILSICFPQDTLASLLSKCTTFYLYYVDLYATSMKMQIAFYSSFHGKQRQITKVLKGQLYGVSVLFCMMRKRCLCETPPRNLLCVNSWDLPGLDYFYYSEYENCCFLDRW